MQAATLGGVQNLFGTQIVAIGVSGALAGDYADADAERNALRGALDDGFVHADVAGGQILEVQIGVVAAAGKRFIQIAFQIAFGDVKPAAEK